MNELLGEFQEACYLLKRKWVYVHKRLDDNYFVGILFEIFVATLILLGNKKNHIFRHVITTIRHKIDLFISHLGYIYFQNE